MPGPAFLRHEAEHSAVLLHHVVRTDLGLRIAQAGQRRLPGLHAGIVQDKGVRRSLAGVEVRRRRVDEVHAVKVYFEPRRMARASATN